ncbi:RNA polymerase sigma factor [Verrucomicrobiota bacterium]
MNNPAGRSVHSNGDSPSADLLERAQAGEMEAFAALFESLRPAVFAVACRLAGPGEAEDIVMETYLRAWQALPRFGRRSSLKTWLYRIAYNCSVDFIRSRSRIRRHEVSSEAGDAAREIPDTSGRSPDREVAKAELISEVRAALEALPREHRVALQLRFTDGLSYSEIAAASGVSIGTVMSRLFYGKRKLRDVMRRRTEER